MISLEWIIIISIVGASLVYVLSRFVSVSKGKKGTCRSCSDVCRCALDSLKNGKKKSH